MQIKTFKGYNDTTGIEVQGELTLEDFIVIEKGPERSDWTENVQSSIAIELKNEVVQRISSVLPKPLRDSAPEDEVQTSWVKYQYDALKFNGCKTEESKEKKVQKTISNARVRMATHKELWITELIGKVNKDINTKVERLNRSYTQSIFEVFDGTRLHSEFKETYLDEPEIMDEIEDVKELMSTLRGQLAELSERLQTSRNVNMAKYLTDEGWEAENDEGVEIMDDIKDNIMIMYKNGEAFNYRDCFGRRLG